MPESDSNRDEELQPTATQVLTGIDTVQRYASALDDQEKAVEAICVYERYVLPALQTTIQAKLRDFMLLWTALEAQW